VSLTFLVVLLKRLIANLSLRPHRLLYHVAIHLCQVCNFYLARYCHRLFVTITTTKLLSLAVVRGRNDVSSDDIPATSSSILSDISITVRRFFIRYPRSKSRIFLVFLVQVLYSYFARKGRERGTCLSFIRLTFATASFLI